MHILHVIDSLGLGGAERMLCEIANQSAADGYRVSVCATRTAGPLSAALRPDVAVHVAGRRSRFDLGGLLRVAKIINESRADLIHAQGRSSGALLALLKLTGIIRTPLILHDQYGGCYGDPAAPLWFRSLAPRAVDWYVAVCQRLAEWAISAGFPRGRVRVIVNAMNLDSLRQAQAAPVRQQIGAGNDVVVGACVTNFKPEKGIDVLLKALALSRRRRALRVLVFGGARDPAYARACRSLCSELGLDETVAFPGERQDVPQVLKAVDFGVLPSCSESGPLALIEYMAAALPFVATRVGGVADLAARDGIGEFVPPGDPEALAAALDRLLSLSPAERRARGEAGARFALERLDIRQTIGEWYELYRLACEGRPGCDC